MRKLFHPKLTLWDRISPALRSAFGGENSSFTPLFSGLFCKIKKRLYLCTPHWAKKLGTKQQKGYNYGNEKNLPAFSS